MTNPSSTTTHYKATTPHGKRKIGPRSGPYTTPMLQATAFLDWMVEHHIDRFDVAIMRLSASSPSGIFIEGPKGTDRHGVSICWGWLRHENSNNASVYIRPARGLDWPILFLDDVTPAMANDLANRYAAMLVETSSDSFHAWIATDHPLNEHGRFTHQSQLVSLVGADPGSVSGEHWGRLPGFTNRKPGKEKVWVNLRHVTEGERYPVSLDSNNLAQADLGSNSLPNRIRKPSTDVADRVQDESAGEWRYVCSALEAGLPPTVVERNLLEHCLVRRGADATRYVRRTMQRALELVHNKGRYTQKP